MRINPLRKEFPINTLGKDYIIGDLHGRYDLFERLLKAINFDKTKDRMFSVGDLVDRGPQSLECLRLILEDWFHFVLANHEVMMFHAFNDTEPWYEWRMAESWIPNGGGWGIRALVAHRKGGPIYDDTEYETIQLIKMLKDVPLTINIKTKTGYVHIIHAEYPENIALTDKMLTDDAELEKLYNMAINYNHGHGFTWLRSRFYDFYKMRMSESNVDTLAMRLKNKPIGSSESLIVSGHTNVTVPIRINNFLNIDTYAYAVDEYDYAGLTCYNINDDNLITVHKDRINYAVKPQVFDVSQGV